jgi:glycosyltransferase involved in cell wall biosynthesis
MMRVLLVSHGASFGGAERSLVEIAGYLSQRGMDVVVALPDDGPVRRALEERGVATAVLPYRWAVRHAEGEALDDLVDLPALAEFVRDLAPGAIVTNTSVIPWFAFLANQFGIPHLWFVREDVVGHVGIAYVPDVATTLAMVQRWADVIFVPSHHLRRRLSGPLGRSDIQVAYPTFDSAIMRHAKPPDADPGSARRILLSGTIAPHKNQMEAIQAFALLCPSRPDLELTIMGAIGSAAYYEEVADFVAQEQLAVRFVPHTDEPWQTIAEHDICVVASRSEASSRAMIESMLLGLAVVASDVDGNPEKAGGEARAALLYKLGRPDDLAAKLATLIDSDDEFREQVRRGRAYAQSEYLERDQLSGLGDAVLSLDNLPEQSRPGWITGALIDLAGGRRAAIEERDALLLVRDRLVTEADALSAEREGIVAQYANLSEERDRLAGELAAAQLLVAAYDGSRSWQVTGPARTIGRVVRNFLRGSAEASR